MRLGRQKGSCQEDVWSSESRDIHDGHEVERNVVLSKDAAVAVEESTSFDYAGEDEYS